MTIKLFIGALILILLIFVSASETKAADVDVICESSGCSGFSSQIFNDVDLVPGDSVSKTIDFKNLTGENINIKLNSSKDSETDDIFAQNLTFIIYKNGSILYSNYIWDFFEKGSIDLGSISNNQTQGFEIQANFSKELGNELQDKKIIFDLSFTVISEDGSSQVLTTSSSQQGENSSNNTIHGQVLGLSDTSGEFFMNLIAKLSGLIIFLWGVITLIKLINTHYRTRRPQNYTRGVN